MRLPERNNGHIKTSDVDQPEVLIMIFLAAIQDSVIINSPNKKGRANCSAFAMRVNY